MSEGARRDGHRSEDGRFTPELMYSAASLYYLQDSTQAEIAEHLGMSRATVSRLLSEARRVGIVRIDVVSPVVGNGTDLGARAAAALGLRSVRVAPYMARSSAATALGARGVVGAGRGPPAPGRGPARLVGAGDLRVRPGAPAEPAGRGRRADGGGPGRGGGVVPDERDRAAGRREDRRHARLPLRPRPARPDLYERLVEDRSVHRVVELWNSARCALIGVGAPPALRSSLPSFVAPGAVRTAAGDVCTRHFDDSGEQVRYDGVDRLIAIPLDVLRKVPMVIAVAHGAEKVRGIVAAARAGYFTELVTDIPTATALLAAVEDGGRAAGP